MTLAIILGIVIPLAFWLLDILIKMLGSFRLDDVGADLCLFGVSFNLATVLVSFSHQEGREDYFAISALALVISLVFYLFTLLIIAPGKRRQYPALLQFLRSHPKRFGMTVVIGFIVVLFQTILYVLSF